MICRLTFILLLTAALSVLFCLPAAAQTIHKIAGVEAPLCPPQYFRFVLIMGAVQKATHQNTEGNYEIKSSVQPGWEGGADYLHNISHTFYYGLGVHLAVTGRSTVFPYPASTGNPPEKDRQFDPVLALPLFAEKQWRLALKRALYADAGVQLNVPISSEYTGFSIALQDSSGNYTQIYKQNAQAFHNGKPWLGYKLGVGMMWALKGENLLSTGIVATFSSTDFMRGTYQVTIPGQTETIGDFKANGSYVGVQVSYGLTRKYRKRIREHA